MSSFRPIRPKGSEGELSGSSNLSDLTSSSVQRSKVTTACKTCRARKAKCNGQRPSCDTCAQRNLTCEYPPPPLDENAKALARDSQRLLEVLRTAPEPVAEEALRHIRSGMTPNAILQAVKERSGTPSSSPAPAQDSQTSPSQATSPVDSMSAVSISDPYIDIPPLGTSDPELAPEHFDSLGPEPVPSGWKGDPALLSKTLSHQKSSSGESNQSK